MRSVNALVGETNDGGLNDIRGLHVTREHVIAAITGATSGPVAEGTVGAGTGTVNYGWKGGIGTSSRKLPADRGSYTVGVLAQTNFGGNLTIAGVPVFRSLQPPRSARAAAANDNRRRLLHARRRDRRAARRARSAPARRARDLRPGAHRIVVQQRQRRLRDRLLDLARDAQPVQRDRAHAPHTILPTEATSPLFEAALEATEEAVYNALFQATTVRSAIGSGRGDPDRRESASCSSAESMRLTTETDD